MAASLQVKELNDWHESLIDYIIANPSATLRLKARQFGVSIAWISIVENSDAFKEKMKQRREEHFQNISVGVVNKLQAMADTVVDEINHRLDHDNASSIPLGVLKDLGDMALKNLGFGNRFGPPPQLVPTNASVTNNTVIVADKDSLKDARAMMESLRAKTPAVELEQTHALGPTKTIEGEVVSIKAESSAPEE